jgi:hypothetical protein
MSQLILDMFCKQKHIPRKIMQDLYYKTPNPRRATMALYIKYNYPAYDNDHDIDLIWEYAHKTDEAVFQLFKERKHFLRSAYYEAFDIGFWNKLVAAKGHKYGISALSTYDGARRRGFNVSDSLRLMKLQVAEIGNNYPGGELCRPYRGKENIEKALVRAITYH